jgi:heme A synthase
MPKTKKKPMQTKSLPVRVGIINAINSPLGFYVLALLIAEAAIGMVLVESDLTAKDKFYGLILAVGMFVLVVIVVTLLVWFKPKNLTFDRDAHLEVFGSNKNSLERSQLRKLPSRAFKD